MARPRNLQRARAAGTDASRTETADPPVAAAPAEAPAPADDDALDQAAVAVPGRRTPARGRRLSATREASVAVLLRRRQTPDLPGAPALFEAFVVLRLHAVTHMDHASRIDGLAQLVSRLGESASTVVGDNYALEVRYVVMPAIDRGGPKAESVTCYLVARVRRWCNSPSVLRRRARALATSLQDLLAELLPGYRFVPLSSARAIGKVLAPFRPADTVEIRRRALHLPGGYSQPMPLQGVPDIGPILELMLRQRAPSLFSCCIEPLGDVSIASPSSDEGPLSAAIRRIHHSPRYRLAVDEAAHEGELAAAYEDVALQRWQVQRLAALRMAPFRLRMQLASARAVPLSVTESLAGEVGGPGRLTAGLAWRDPTLPLARGAECVRPRSSHLQGESRSAFDIALENLRSLDFIPWGDSESSVSEALYLADLGEVARCFALPVEAPWLPALGVARPLPYRAAAHAGVRLGVNRVRGLPRPVLLPQASRPYHTWILGVTGSGKSTLLEQMILQDIWADRGVIVVDPHGDLIRNIIGRIPAARIPDVILFDPADRDFPLGLNPLEVSGEDEQALVVSSFIGLLIKLYDPHHTGIIGPRFEHGARNVMFTVMSTPGNTLVEVLRAFQDDQFVYQTLLPQVTDPLVKRYWLDQVANTNSFHRSEVLDWLVSKFSHFVTDHTMRRILGQSKSSFSFRQAMDEGKIVLLSLAKGRLGSENANFLGLVLLPMVLQAALSRGELPDDQRRPAALYIDEFQNYATDSLALMLAEARKYRVALTLANQHVGQLTQDIHDALIGNVGSLIAFRLGVADAQAMELMLSPSPVHATDLTTLPNYSAYARLLVDGQRCPAFTLETEPVAYTYDAARAEEVRRSSQMRYGRPRAEVDAEIHARAQLG